MRARLTIFRKGLALIAVPLLFQLVFFALLADMQNSNAQAVTWSIHSKEVLRQTQVVLRSLLEMGTGLRGNILANDPDLGVAYERATKQLPLDIEELRRRILDNPGQAAQVEVIAVSTREFMAWHAETIRLSHAGKRDEAIARAKSETSARLQSAIVDAVMTFIRTEDGIDKERAAALERSQARQRWLLVIGTGISFLITLGLAFVFSRGFSSRLATLAGNAQRLARGEELAPPFRGSDEVAQLDRAFRGMGQEIAASAQSLRRSAEEIRGLYDQAKRSEQEIRGLNENLERRIAERTAELARANSALREADRLKDDFLAMLAHELRNPLAPVRNALHVLRAVGPTAGPDWEAREMIERQVRHLVRLVDDLLDVSRVMRGKIELRKEPVDLAAVFADAVETAQPAFAEHNQALSVSVPPSPVRVEADSVRLSQVIGNLLANAAKYTDQAGRIWLTGELVGPEIVIRVRDTGIGIDRELLPRVFDPFVQADSSLARSRGGLGIGLTLVKNLVELHGGCVEARSAGLGKGSEFVVLLPVASAERGARSAEREEDSSAFRAPRCALPKRVLVVDDNADAAASAALLLRSSGHEVRVAHDGHSALETVQAFRPEIVLLDIGLPGMSGYDVARALRARPECRGLVIAAVTGYGQEQDRRRSREAGFDHHLIKPVPPAALTAFVASPGQRGSGER